MINQIINKYEKEDDALIKLLLTKLSGDIQLQNGMLNEDKSVSQLNGYINQEARKYLEGKNGYIQADTVVGWAIHYFTESNETLGLNIEREVQPVVNKPEKDEPVVITNASGVRYEALQMDLFGE